MNSALSYLLKAFALIPGVLSFIEAVHGEKDVATKTQMATQAIEAGAGVATEMLPEADDATIAVVTGAVQDGLSAAINAAHAIKTGGASATA